MIKGFYKNKQTELYYQVEGEGIPLVFLHGFSLDHRMWADQVAYFSKNYQVITYDMRGYGKSSIPIEPYSHHEDLHNLLDYLKVEKTHIVGLSLGGEIAIDYAISYPSSVLSLTLIDSSFSGYRIKEDWNVSAKEVGIEQAKQNWLNHRVFEATGKNENALKQLKDMVKDYSGWHWVNVDPRERLVPQSMKRLSEIKVPTLILIGENDLKYFKEQADYLHKSISNSEKLIIPNAGHMSNIENSTEVNKAIEFLLSR